MRIVFMGTGDIAIPAFRSLVENGKNVVGLITQPDRPAGRHQVLTPPPLKPLAIQANIPVQQPESLRSPEAVALLQEWKPDLIVVMAYGQIIPRSILDLPGLECVNLHASLLPKHRGASCIQASIAEGDSEVGVTLMHVAPKLDSGDIIAQESRLLCETETGGDLHDDMAVMAAALLMRLLPSLENKTAPRTVQVESNATYAPKLHRKDGQLNWNKSSGELARKIRAYSPWPGTYTTFQDQKGMKKTLKIHPPVEVSAGQGTPGQVIHAHGDTMEVACSHGSLIIHCLQPEGSRRMNVREFLNGFPYCEGIFLGL